MEQPRNKLNLLYPGVMQQLKEMKQLYRWRSYILQVISLNGQSNYTKKCVVKKLWYIYTYTQQRDR